MRGVGILEALALADGVVGEDGEAVAGEGGGEGVVAGFAGGAVAGSDDDGGEFGAFFSVGDIEERGDGEVGLAVEEDFFDAEAVGLRGAEDWALSGVFAGKVPMRVRTFLRTLAWRASAWALVLMAATTARRSAVSLAAMASR